MKLKAAYSPAVFDVPNQAAAKAIILTPENGLTTAQRWERETPYLASMIERKLKALDHNSIVLDYGCGLGRLAKELIEVVGCRVVGVDISTNMRALAADYVRSERFLACHPDMLGSLGVKFDAALSIWVLQHVQHLPLELKRIAGALKPGAPLFVVNEGLHGGRVIPTVKGWMNDGVDLRKSIAADFELASEGRLAANVVTKAVADRTFWAIYRKAR